MIMALAARAEIRARHLLLITAVSTFVFPSPSFDLISSLVEINPGHGGRLRWVCGQLEWCDRPQVLRDELKWNGSVLGLEY